MIFGIYGRKRAGKDTTFDVMSEVAREMGMEAERRKFADKLYDSVAALLNITRAEVELLKEWSEQDGDTPPLESLAVFVPSFRPEADGVAVSTKTLRFTMRTIMERMGTEVGRNIFGDDFWVDQTFPGGAFDYYTDRVYGATDMRFPNEYDRVRALGGKVIKIIGTPEIQAENITGHASRGALIEDRDYDWVIDNSERDMDKLRSQVVEMMSVLA